MGNCLRSSSWEKGIADPESRPRVQQEISLLEHEFFTKTKQLYPTCDADMKLYLYTFYMQ